MDASLEIFMLFSTRCCVVKWLGNVAYNTHEYEGSKSPAHTLTSLHTQHCPRLFMSLPGTSLEFKQEQQEELTAIS
jgi:hypothetical protein